MFYQNDGFTQAAGRDAISSRLGKIAAAAEELGQPQMFGPEFNPSRMEIITHATNDGQGYLFTSSGDQSGLKELGQAGKATPGGADRTGRGQAAQAGGQAAGSQPERSGAQSPYLNQPDPALLTNADQMQMELKAASQRVGLTDSLVQQAKDLGVNAVTGDYLESSDIAAMRDRGALTPEDVKSLDNADTNFETADGYGKALKIAAECIGGA
jgi:hypothetical protein